MHRFGNQQIAHRIVRRRERIQLLANHLSLCRDGRKSGDQCRALRPPALEQSHTVDHIARRNALDLHTRRRLLTRRTQRSKLTNRVDKLREDESTLTQGSLETIAEQRGEWL